MAAISRLVHSTAINAASWPFGYDQALTGLALTAEHKAA
jgi:hypothetical protein